MVQTTPGRYCSEDVNCTISNLDSTFNEGCQHWWVTSHSFGPGFTKRVLRWDNADCNLLNLGASNLTNSGSTWFESVSLIQYWDTEFVLMGCACVTSMDCSCTRVKSMISIDEAYFCFELATIEAVRKELLPHPEEPETLEGRISTTCSTAFDRMNRIFFVGHDWAAFVVIALIPRWTDYSCD